jgi:hypothetical protein
MPVFHNYVYGQEAMIDSLVDYLSVYSMLFCLLPASAGFLLG